MHSCMFKNTTFHEWAFTRYSLLLEPISLGLLYIHVCLKTRIFMNGIFIRYSFHSQIHCIDGSATCFRFSQHNLGNSEPRHKKTWKLVQQIGSSGGRVLHATSQVVGRVGNNSWSVMDGWRQWIMKPTLASQSMVGMTTSILPKEGKTNEYRSRTSRSE